MSTTPSFEEAYKKYRSRVLSICYRFDPANAEDLCQDCFLQLHRKIHTFRGESAFSTWLHRLSLNTCLMHVRKKQLPVSSLDEMFEHMNDGEVSDYYSAVSVDDKNLQDVIDNMSLNKVVAAIQQLPPGYRTFLILHDYQGLEFNEIAEVLGCSIGNVKSQCSKAKAKVRQILKLHSADDFIDMNESFSLGRTIKGLERFI